jgi:hypothetical protein
MPTPTTYPSAKAVVGLAVETTQGTANTTLAATLLLDEPLDVEDKYVWLPDNGMRGSMTDRYNTIQGPVHVELSGKGACFMDTLPFLLVNILGERVTTGAGPYVHTIGLLNSGTGQPSSLTVVDWQGLTGTSFARTYSGVCLSELVLKGNPESTLVEFSFKALGWLSADYPTSPPTFSPSTDAPIAAWRTAVGVAGPASGGTLYKLMRDWQWTISRELKPIYTSQNLQTPWIIQRGKLTAAGSAYIAAPSDETVLDYLLNNTSPQLQHLVDNGGVTTASRKLQIDAQSNAFNQVKINRSEEAVGYDTAWDCNANTTNASATSGGYAPVKVVVTNNTASGY